MNRPTMSRFAITAAIALMVAGCTFEPGNPWGYLDTELTADAVDDSGGAELHTQSVRFGEFELRAPGDAGGGVDDFDPADPPPGFTLCHQDHCHHEDGGIYTYDEIEEGTGLDPDQPVSIKRVDLATGPLDLLQSAGFAEQFSIADETRVNEVAVAVDELAVEGTIDDGDKSVDVDISLAMSTRPLSTGVLYEFGRDEPETQQMELQIRWPDDLFDDLAELDDLIDDADDGDTIEIHGTSHPDLRETLVDRVADDARFEWIEP